MNERWKEGDERKFMSSLFLSPSFPLSLRRSERGRSERGTMAMTTMMMWGATLPPPLIPLILSSNRTRTTSRSLRNSEGAVARQLGSPGERERRLSFFALFCPLSTINGHKAPFFCQVLLSRPAAQQWRPLILMDLSLVRSLALGWSVGCSCSWL